MLKLKKNNWQNGTKPDKMLKMQNTNSNGAPKQPKIRAAWKWQSLARARVSIFIFIADARLGAKSFYVHVT